jgi:large subunit ribosomal protein L13
MKTANVKPADIQKNWFVVDVSQQQLGRISAEIASVLRGKHKPSFSPQWDCGDFVIVTNAAQIGLSGKKLTDKEYHHHTGYVGGIKTQTAKEMLAAHPERMIEKAVKGMLPKSKLSRQIMKNLKVYAGAEHPHEAQKPMPFPSRAAKHGETK